MLKHTLQRHLDHVHLKWFACAVISTHSQHERRGVNEPKSCTNLVALDKVSINSHREVGGGILRIGRSVGEPVFIVSKALQRIVVCLGRGASQGTRKNRNVQEGATYDFAHGGYVTAELESKQNV